MIYMFHDESGDFVYPNKNTGNTDDVVLSLITSDDNDIAKLSRRIDEVRNGLGKHEIKFHKLSKRERKHVLKEFKRIGIEFYTSYRKKDNFFVYEFAFKEMYEELCVASGLIKDRNKRTKVYFDGVENKKIRKYLGGVLSKFLNSFSIHFGNSLKFPLLQAADFYAGLSRFLKRNISSDDDINLKELE